MKVYGTLRYTYKIAIYWKLSIYIVYLPIKIRWKVVFSCIFHSEGIHGIHRF